MDNFDWLIFAGLTIGAVNFLIVIWEATRPI
jgi:hypothetical protein